MDEKRESRAQAHLLLGVGALVLLTALSIALRIAEPSSDPAELDGDPDGAMFDAVGFLSWSVLVLVPYALIALIARQRLSRLPVFLPESVLGLTASRLYLPAVVAGLLFGIQGVAINSSPAIVWLFALVGIATARLRSAGGWSLFLGVATGTAAGIHLNWLYGVATV